MALPHFCLSFIPILYSTHVFPVRTTQANIIAVSRGIVIKARLIFSVPLLFGSDAIWIAPFFAEILALILTIYLSRKTQIIYQ